MKHENLPNQKEVVDAFVSGLTAEENAEQIAGMCWRFTRQRLAVAGVPDNLIPPRGVDANGAARWYRKYHPELCKENGSVPGDVLFYEEGHGPHGHVGGRIPRNRLAENSVAHAPEGKADGRGIRALSRVGTPTLILRMWRDV